MRHSLREFCFVLLPLVPAPMTAQATGAARAALAAPDIALGKRAFDINCSRCHGIGATGNTGPSLAQPILPRARDDAALRKVIENGIDGTEMPRAFWLSERDVLAIIAYVRSLGRVAPEALTGDAARGAAAYQRAGCAACHVMNGAGGAAGPELSDIGTKRSARHLRESILAPAAAFPTEGGYQQFLVIRAVTRDGRTLTGVRVNEDSYTIQLRDASGRFHSLRKAQLRSLDKDFKASMMPAFRDHLTDAEVEDIVAYLVSARSDK